MEGFKPVRLAYSTYEPATGADETLAPVVFLHGISALKENWADIPQKVADATKRKSYSVDARNHGDSEWSDHFNFDVNVEDFIHFLDIIGIQKVALVGHSMGGVTVIKTALKLPDRVESVVVEDMVVRKIPKAIIEPMNSMVTMTGPALEKVPAELDDRKAAKFVFRYLLDNAPPELKEVMDKSLQESHLESFCILLKRDAEGRFALKCNLDVIGKAIVDYDNLATEPEGVFDGPALFIYGTQSPFRVGDDEEHIKQFFPNAVLEAMEAEHSVHLTKPVEFTEAVLKFLS